MIFFKPKQVTAMKFAEGEVKDITEVKDHMFSEKMLGDGCFIIPSEEKTRVVSPVKGKITMVFETLHAIGFKTKEGIEGMIHYGLDTVHLKGEGFDINVEVGDEVNQGDLIMTADNSVIRKAGFDNSIILIFTDQNDYKLNKSFDSEEIIEFLK